MKSSSGPKLSCPKANQPTHQHPFELQSPPIPGFGQPFHGSRLAGVAGDGVPQVDPSWTLAAAAILGHHLSIAEALGVSEQGSVLLPMDDSVTDSGSS